MARRALPVAVAVVLLTTGIGAAAPDRHRVGAVEVSRSAGLGQIELHRELAAVVQRDEGLVALVDVSDPTRPKVLGRYDGKAPAGPVDPYDGDVAFSADGNWLFYARQTHQFSQDGVHVVNISDPTNPTLAFYQPQGGTLRVAYFKQGDAEYVISLDAIHGLVINRFVAPALVPVFADPQPVAAKVGGPASAGLAIDPKDPKLEVPLLYVASASGLEVYDLSVPETPAKLGSWADEGLADIEVVASKKSRIVYAAQEYWFDNAADPAVHVLDATDLGGIKRTVSWVIEGANPDALRVQGMAVGGHDLLVTASGAGLLVLNRKRRAIEWLNLDFGSPNDAAEVPFSPYAMDVELKGDFAYVTDASTGTLTILTR